MNRMLLKYQAQRATNRQRCQHKENDQRCRHFIVPHRKIAKLVITTLAMDTGSSIFHPKAISWSYRKRGKVPRIHTYTNKNTKIFDSSQNGAWMKLFTPGKITSAIARMHITAPIPGKITLPKIVS